MATAIPAHAEPTLEESLAHLHDLFHTPRPARGEVPEWAQEWFAVQTEHPATMPRPDDPAADMDVDPDWIIDICGDVRKSTAQWAAKLFNRQQKDKPEGEWAIVRTRAWLEERGFELAPRPEPAIDYQGRFDEAERLTALVGPDITIEYDPTSLWGESHEQFEHIPTMGHLFTMAPGDELDDNLPLTFTVDDREGELLDQFAKCLRAFAAGINEHAEKLEALATNGGAA